MTTKRFHSTNPPTQRFRYGDVIIVSLAHLAHDIFSSFLAPVLPLLIKKFDLSYSLSSLLSIFQRLPSLLNPVVGIISDKIKPSYFIIAAPTLTSVSMCLLGLAPSYAVVVMLLLIMGIGASLFHVPAPVIIKRLSGNRTGRGMSFYMLGGEAARTLGPVVILGAISLWGFQETWKLIPAGMFISVLLFLKFRTLEVNKSFNDNKPVKTGNKSGKRISRVYFYLFSMLAGFFFCMNFIKSSITFYLPTYLTLKGNSLWLSGVSLSVFQLSGAAGTFLSGTISDYIGRKRMLLIASLASPVIMLLFVHSKGIILIFGLLLALGLFIFSVTPVWLAFITNITSERPSFINGIFMTVTFVVNSINILLIGILSDMFGLEKIYMIVPFIAVFASIFVLLLSKKIDLDKGRNVYIKKE
jgi:MFS transporter, FSR family, fosmidomycin resistance protein